ncbi:hypothetical protein QZH41_003182 [Actinostola sp. cb2023]|nr:hypothetical protein QZH41_003182 [Actinostola sp. cb2023]
MFWWKRQENSIGNMELSYAEVTNAFLTMAHSPSEVRVECMTHLERSVILLYAVRQDQHEDRSNRSILNQGVYTVGYTPIYTCLLNYIHQSIQPIP